MELPAPAWLTLAPEVRLMLLAVIERGLMLFSVCDPVMESVLPAFQVVVPAAPGFHGVVPARVILPPADCTVILPPAV